MIILSAFLPLITWSFVVCNEAIELSTKSAKDAVPDGSNTKLLAKLLAKADAQEQEIKRLAEAVQLQNKVEEETSSKRSSSNNPYENMYTFLKHMEKTVAEKIEAGVENSYKYLDEKVTNLQEGMEKRVEATSESIEKKLAETKEAMSNLKEEVSYSGDDKEIEKLLQLAGTDPDKTYEAKEVKRRIQEMDDTMMGLKKGINDRAEELKNRIDRDPNLSDEEKKKLNAEVEKRKSKLEHGVEKSRLTYRKMEVNVNRGSSGYTTSKKARALIGLNLFGSKMLEKGNEITAAITSSIGQVITLMDPEQPWQKRTEAGLAIVASFTAFLPQPYGLIGSSILGIAGAAFAAAAPTTNEYKVLRNQLLNGISEMFDNQQKGDAMGCVYKLEFLTEIMEIQSTDEKFSSEEFNAIVISGGIDVGVSTLGNLKWKSEDFRDKNELETGRQALEMAHMFVLVAEARDALMDQIVSYLNLRTDCKEAGLEGGFSITFFIRARDISRKNYKDLFWWDELCCEKENYVSALLAYGMPIKKHTGEDKAVGKIHKFIEKHRSKDYDKESETMSLEECPVKNNDADPAQVLSAMTPDTATPTMMPMIVPPKIGLAATPTMMPEIVPPKYGEVLGTGIPETDDVILQKNLQKKFEKINNKYIVLGSMLEDWKDYFLGVSTTDVTIQKHSGTRNGNEKRKLKSGDFNGIDDQWLKTIGFMSGEFTERTKLKFEYLENPKLGDPFAVKVNADLPGCFVKAFTTSQFQGTSHVYRGKVRQVASDDTLSSLKVPEGCCVELWKDKNFKGASRKFCGIGEGGTSFWNIGTKAGTNNMYNSDSSWNDAVSSLIVTENNLSEAQKERFRSFVTTMEAVVNNRDKIYDDDVDQGANRHWVMEDTLKKKYKKSYKKWSLVAMQKVGTLWSKKTAYNYEEEMTKDKAYVRLFPVKLPTWGETRYLLGPAGKYIDDDLVLLGVTNKEDKDGKYTKLNKQFIQDNSGTSDKNGRPEMKESVLNSATWKQLFLVVRGDFSDSEEGEAEESSDFYPAELNGGNIDMKCHWTSLEPKEDGSYEHEAINSNKGSYRGCVSSAINWKTRISHSKTRKVDKSSGYTAITMKIPDGSNDDTKDCKAYHNITTLSANSPDRKTCLFKTTKGCYYTIKVTEGSTAKYYHIDGMDNGRNRWLESTEGAKALWFDKKNWCVGTKTRMGKKCDELEEGFIGKIPKPESTPGGDEVLPTGLDIPKKVKSTKEKTPQCPQDVKLKWYHSDTSGSTTNQQVANFKVEKIHWSLP